MCWVCERSRVCPYCGVLYIAFKSFRSACPMCGPEPIVESPVEERAP